MRSSQRSPTPSSIAEEHLAPRPESPADTPAFTHHTQTQAESRACADSHASQLSAASAISPAAWTRMADHNENAASSSSEQLQNNYAGGLQSASASNSAPEASTAPHHQRLSLTLPHDPRAFMQRSLSKESINSAQSAASSTYISPTHVEPGPFSSQSYPFQPQQQHPHYHPEQGEPTSAPHDSFPASGVQRDSITPTNFESTPHPAHSQTPEASASRPLRHRHRSSSQTTDNNRLSINRRNSRWKSFFSFRSDKEGEDDDDAYHDDDEHGYLDPESPGAQHVLFRSKADAPGIIFSPPHGQTDHHNIRVPLNQAADVDWEEMHRRRTAEAESAAAMFRSEDFAQLDSNEQGQMHRSRRGVLSHHALVQSRNSTATMLLNTDDAYAADSQRPPSLYSNYSYYEMPASPAPFPRNQQSQSPMPSSSHTRQPPALQLHPAPPPQQRQPQQYDGTTGGTFQKTKRSIDLLAVPGNSRAPRDAESPTASAPRSDEPMDCLLLGIEKHEKGDLDRAAQYFERAASLKGGVGPGMLLWGLSLRHGWGVKADPARGFRWLQRAAESVVGDLDGIVQRGTLSLEEHEQATSAARHELVLSIYELGMCFRQGWGVKKDRKVALMYFELAASLGDADAQQELAFCYLKGKGCKTDKMKAAQFFRMAEAQGVTQWCVNSPLCPTERQR